MWALSSLTRDQTRTPYIGKWSRNPWTARAVPGLLPWLPSPHFTCRFLPSELLFILQNPFSRSLWRGLVLWGWPEHHMPWGSAAPPRTHMQKGAVSSSLLSSQLARSWVASAGARLILNVWCQSGAWHIVASQKASCKWPDRGLGWSESEASSHSWNMLNNKEAPTLLPELYFSWKYIRTSRGGIFILFSCTYTALSFLCPEYNQLQPQRQTLHTLKYMAESW